MAGDEVVWVLAECEVRREESNIAPWWGIWHKPTGRRVSGPPQDFNHPMLSRNTPYRPRRWKRKKDAEAALVALSSWAKEVTWRASMRSREINQNEPVRRLEERIMGPLLDPSHIERETQE